MRLPLLLTLIISIPLLGTEESVAQMNRPVNGTLTLGHGFELGANTSCTFCRIRQGQLKEVAEYINNYFSVSDDQLKMRAVLHATTLTIQNLAMNDSGVYDLSCFNAPSPAKRQKVFNLTVYETVQQPAIKIQCQCGYIDCNCTLHCLDSTNSLSPYWVIFKDSQAVLKSAESTIQTWLSNISTSNEYVCVLQNPADQKHASIGYWQICCVSGLSCTLCLYWTIWKQGLCLMVFSIILFVADFILKKITGNGVLGRLKNVFPLRWTRFNLPHNEAKYTPCELELKVLGKD